MSSHLHVELPAEPGAAGRSRRETVRWLAALCGGDVPCATADDLVIAVNEAVSNSIEHAYAAHRPGTVTLHAEVEGAGGPGCTSVRVRMVVSDRGAWREPRADNGFRGRGLGMIRACAEDVTVEPGPDGTTVTFHRTLGGCPLARAS
ncbi:ATP-binding protein [Pseudonocardia nematodicida]|uniref:ATP-binding protein n=1 Tax=Pseudonocardia nematodicida TaxID=1206997 RepID=A0ABV1KBX0_9PSEU